MAWRVEESIIRGEIDNRVHGRVTGRIWFAGRAEPVELELAGNCWRDLAGRRLEFTNPEPKPGNLEKFAMQQQGAVGDITASRKVKVPDIPMDQIGEYYAAKKPWPWHWGNSLYLEWFSECNGRVVVESAGYALKIIGEPAWEMTPEEEIEQRQANGEALKGFMDRLVETAEASRTPGDEEWKEKPQTEEDAEAMQERSDRLMDRIQARLARSGDEGDYEKIIHEEIERMRVERGEPEPTPEQLARNAEWIEEMNHAGEEALDDPELLKELNQQHPLAERAFELALRLRREAKQGSWLPEGANQLHPIAELVDGVTIASAKLAGALDGQDWPPEVEICASIIVRLRRARIYLDDAVRAVESCQEQKLLEPAWMAVILCEIVDLAHDADEIITQLRGILERGTD